MTETLDEPLRSPSPTHTPPSPSDPPDPTVHISPSPPHKPSRPPPSSVSRKLGGKKRRPLTAKKRTALEQRISLLHQNLIPKPFLMSFDVDLHQLEPVLSSLGLWNFATTPLPSEIRRDILIELIAYYDPPNRRSFVWGNRINVTRATLAHSLSLPLLVKRPLATEPEEPLRSLVLSHSTAIRSFLMNCMILGEEMIVPDAARAAIDLVESGKAWKVDWSGLLLIMVEKDLAEATTSGLCYYASHLQQLVMHQKPHLFHVEPLLEVPLAEEDITDVVEDIADAGNPVDADGVNLVSEQPLAAACFEAGEEDSGVGGDVEMVNEDDGMGWSDDAVLRPCTKDHVPSMVCGEECKSGDENVAMEERVENVGTCQDEFMSGLPGFDVPNDVIRDVDVGNDPFCPGTQADQEGEFVGSQEDHKLVGANYHNGSPLFQNNGKRTSSEVEGEDDDDDNDEDEDVHRLSQQQPHKKPRTETWGQTSNVYLSLEKASTWMEKAKMYSIQQEQEVVNAQMQVNYLKGLVEHKDQMIESLQRFRQEELEARQIELRHFQHEHSLMARMVIGYQKTLRETRAAFEDYRKRFPQSADPIYTDVGGPGGIVITVKESLELEVQRLKKRENDNHSVVQIVLQFANTWSEKFEGHLGDVVILANKLNDLCEERNLLMDRVRKAKSSVDEFKMSVIEEGIDEAKKAKSSIFEDGIDEGKCSVSVPL